MCQTTKSLSSNAAKICLTNHEEAELRLVLNVKDATQNKYKQVLVLCMGTDVLLLLYHIGCKKIWGMNDVRKVKAEKRDIQCRLFY